MVEDHRGRPLAGFTKRGFPVLRPAGRCSAGGGRAGRRGTTGAGAGSRPAAGCHSSPGGGAGRIEFGTGRQRVSVPLGQKQPSRGAQRGACGGQLGSPVGLQVAGRMGQISQEGGREKGVGKGANLPRQIQI